MSVTTLVLSNPPYGVFDGRCAAPVLGLTAADVGLKAHYPIPEIWLAPEDRPAANDAAGRLERCGLPVVVAPAHALADVPVRTHVTGFAFEVLAPGVLDALWGVTEPATPAAATAPGSPARPPPTR